MVGEKRDERHISPETQEADDIGLTRQKINETLLIMGVITPEERRGNKYVRVEEDGSISFNRDFMLNILKESSVIIPPKISDKDLAEMFAEIVLGDEFGFFVGNTKIKTMEKGQSFAKLKPHKRIKLTKAA